MRIKKIALMLCLVIAFGAFSGCEKEKTNVLTIGAAYVDSEIFAYLFNYAYNELQAQGEETPGTSEIIDSAVNYCGEYVSSITLFEQMNLKLTTDDKKSMADETEEEWKLYGSYYSDAGISKQTVLKIKESRAMRTALLLYYFGEGSEYEVKEEEIEYYFDRTYVQFQAINGYLTTINELNETLPLSQEEQEKLMLDFRSKKQRLEAGASLAEVNDGNEVEANFVAVENTAYPKGFLEQVAQLEYNKPTIIQMEDYIFLVIRQDAKSAEENYYKSYRTSYIEALRGENLTDMLVATMEDYLVTRSDEGIAEVAEKVLAARNNRK